MSAQMGALGSIAGTATSALGGLAAGLGPLGLVIGVVAGGVAAFSREMAQAKQRTEEMKRSTRELNASLAALARTASSEVLQNLFRRMEEIPQEQELQDLERAARGQPMTGGRFAWDPFGEPAERDFGTEARLIAAQLERTEKRLEEGATGLGRQTLERRRESLRRQAAALQRQVQRDQPGLLEEGEEERRGGGGRSARVVREENVELDKQTELLAALKDLHEADLRLRQEKADAIAAENRTLEEQVRLQEQNAREMRKLSDITVDAADGVTRHGEALRQNKDDLEDWRTEGYSNAQLFSAGFGEAMETAGETLAEFSAGALQDSVGAWLDGALSFEEAAKQMVDGVIKALVAESIVQAVVETARGVAALAGVVTAPLAAGHFAAAASWAAVGTAAGVAGALMGSFGGGGGGGGGEVRAPERAIEQPREQDAGPTTIVVNWNSPVVTAGDRAQLGQQIGELVEEGRRRAGGRV
jgi:hypothetical protein